MRSGPQGSAERQSSSKQCLLSWRWLDLSGRPGYASLPDVTVKVNDLTLATRLREEREVGVKYKKLVQTSTGSARVNPTILMKCL